MRAAPQSLRHRAPGVVELLQSVETGLTIRLRDCLSEVSFTRPAGLGNLELRNLPSSVIGHDQVVVITLSRHSLHE
jgi:hypothetical protein